MKVALIIERIEQWRGGAERSTMQFARHLASLGCEVTAVTRSHIPSTPTLHIAPIKLKAVTRAGKTDQFARKAARFAQANGFDIIHSISPCPGAHVYQPRGGTIPEVLERNRAIRGNRTQRVLKRVVQSFNRKYRVLAQLEYNLLMRGQPPYVIAISQYVADQLARHYRFDGEHVRIIFNGVDPDLTSPADKRTHRDQIRRQFELAEDDFVLLCVAHNFKLKGVHRFIQALARRKALPDTANTVAVVVGRDNPNPYLELAEQLDVADRVKFAGPTDRIFEYFHAADCLVHPTYYDPCSRVVLEAMAAGLPVITTRFNGAAERITDGEQGYVIDSPDQVDQLADRIGRLMDAEHRRHCADSAPAAVAEFTMAHHARKVHALYEELLSRRAGGKA